MFKGRVRSDHMAIIGNPSVQVKPERKHVYFRDVREHRKINMEKCLLIKVKVLTRDPPYMSPLVKHLCNKRNKQIKMG